MEPKLIDGGQAIDDRGILRFFMDGIPWPRIKRFYTVYNYQQGFCRAWHGHQLESKWVYCMRGAALFKLTELSSMISITNEKDVIEDINLSAKVYSFTLHCSMPKLLYIPAGYFNGFKTLEFGTEIQFFSDADLEQSKNDDYRMDINKFKPEIWQIKER